jgi:transposase
MAKRRKMTTFERLRRGNLTREQRKELGRRLQSPDPGLEIVNRHAAGIDVGSASHFVAVPPDRDPHPIREFGSWTAALEEMAAWLKACKIETVSVQATGVYWVVLCDVLEAAGLKVWVVNAQGTKNLPGRKSDVQECEWLRRLHAYGLLRNSYRPPAQIRGVRDLWRLRGRWVSEMGTTVQQMHKAMVGMNLQLSGSLSDTSGVTGMAIIRAIIAGERDKWKLAKLRQPTVHATEEEIAYSLEGTWREELLLELKQVVEHFDFIGRKIDELDGQLKSRMAAMPSREVAPPAAQPVESEAVEKTGKEAGKKGRPRKPKEKKPPKNAPEFDLGAELTRLLGADLRIIDGVNLMIAQGFYTEVGPDLSAFPTEKHFTAWLGLTPQRSVSGGKVIKHEKKKVKNRLTAALRMGAETLERSQSYLGARFRHLKARLGGRKAVKAMARYLACLIYRLLTKGQVWVDRGEAYFEQKKSEREMLSLQRKARAMGMQLIPVATVNC